MNVILRLFGTAALLSLTLAGVTGVGISRAAARMSVGTAGDTVKILQTSPTGSEQNVQLYGARNEYVSFQILIGATVGLVSGVTPRTRRSQRTWRGTDRHLGVSPLSGGVPTGNSSKRCGRGDRKLA